MLTGFCNVALDVGGRSQPARHVDARGLFYLVGHGAFDSWNGTPILGQSAAFHT